MKLWCCGVGKGGDSIYTGEVCSSFALECARPPSETASPSPLMVVDVGYGVTRCFLSHYTSLPSHILVTHNHSDHAAELPFVLATSAPVADRRKIVIAAQPVGVELRLHRMAEFSNLFETGLPLEGYWAKHWLDLPAATPVSTSPPFGIVGSKSDVELSPSVRVQIETLLCRHSSTPTYGFILYYAGKAILGYGADSGFCEPLYDALSVASTVVLDARRNGSEEHASLADIKNYLAKLNARGYAGNVFVTGYGVSDVAYVRELGLAPLVPGEYTTLC
ncbi:Serine/threonine-protein kinase Nek6 [Pelomyxa schiedti]|nr:Serine/threonine-protein kinase Nek6 [Pelomyxa schiedti]